MKKSLRNWFAAIALALPALAVAAGPSIPLDKANVDLRDTVSLQRGAKLFTNYCLSCHGAAVMRYNRLQDIGLTEAQIRDNLIPTGAKVGDVMQAAMPAKDAKAWFGATPPDLSVIARSRGADWLYTYLRTFYRDETRPTGWNNKVFDKVGMPHVFWEWQGEQVAVYESRLNAQTNKQEQHMVGLKLVKPGELTSTKADGSYDNAEFDQRMNDLVNYMVFMSQPYKVQHEQIGYAVLLFLLFVLIPLVYLLKREYWRDVEH